MMPYHLGQVTAKMTFTEIRNPEQLTYDLRTSGERWDDQHCLQRYTLNHELEVYQEKAELISFEKKKDYFWYSGVFYLPAQETIVHIGGSEKDGLHVDITMFTATEPYKAT